jgi:hypothetical protein
MHLQAEYSLNVFEERFSFLFSFVFNIGGLEAAQELIKNLDARFTEGTPSIRDEQQQRLAQRLQAGGAIAA